MLSLRSVRVQLFFISFTSLHAQSDDINLQHSESNQSRFLGPVPHRRFPVFWKEGCRLMPVTAAAGWCKDAFSSSWSAWTAAAQWSCHCPASRSFVHKRIHTFNMKWNWREMQTYENILHVLRADGGPVCITPPCFGSNLHHFCLCIKKKKLWGTL